MRRLLAAVVVAGPLAAAALTPDPGVVLFDDSTSTYVISEDACASTSKEVSLTWQVKPDVTFTTGGKFNVFVASKDFGSTSPYCYETTETGVVNVRPVVVAGSPDIDAPAAIGGVLKVLTSDLASVTAGAGCTATGTFTSYVCVEWRDSGNAVKGFAKGSATLDLTRPAAPVIDKVTIGDTRLMVEIKPTSGTPEADTFSATAIAVDTAQDSVTHESARVAVTGTATIKGLKNGVAYTVNAYTFSAIGNRSAKSADATPYTPEVVLDAWQLYKDVYGGREEGGCQAGGAGLAALLGALALLRLRRRS